MLLKRFRHKGLAPSSIVFYKDNFPLLFIKNKNLISLNFDQQSNPKYRFQEFKKLLGVDYLDPSFLQVRTLILNFLQYYMILFSPFISGY